MRTRKDIEHQLIWRLGQEHDLEGKLILEVLLDIRDLLSNPTKDEN